MSDLNDAPGTPTDIYIPVDSSGNPFQWDGNPAKIAGNLYECARHYKRKGLFGPLLKNRAVLLSNGKIAVTHIDTIEFLQGSVSDPKVHDLECPCPVIGTRVAAAQQALVDAGQAAHTFPDKLPTGPSDYIINSMPVEAEDGKLLRSLAHVFGHAEPSEALLDDADGSGFALASTSPEHGGRPGDHRR